MGSSIISCFESKMSFASQYALTILEKLELKFGFAINRDNALPSLKQGMFMLFCGVHPYRNQSNKISPVSFFFKNALYVLLALSKGNYLCVILLLDPMF
jgi:hypothetical protein